MLDPTDLTQAPGLVTHVTDTPAAIVQSDAHIPPASITNNTVTFQTRVEVTPGVDSTIAPTDPVRGQFIAAASRYEDTATPLNSTAVLAGVYVQQKRNSTGTIEYFAAPVIALQAPGQTLPHLTLLAPAKSVPDLDYRKVAKGDVLTVSAITKGNLLRVSVFNQDHIQIGQMAEADISGYGDAEAGKSGLISGPVTGAEFDNPAPDASTAPTLDWVSLAGQPSPNLVTASLDNYQYFTMTPKMNLHYEYNQVHELTSVTPDGDTPGPTEAFRYDRAGAMTAHSISNVGLGLPDEQQVYSRDFLGRVVSGDRFVADPTTGGVIHENLAQFSHYGDTYKVRQRSTRQSGSENYETSMPFYAGADEIADMTPNGLQAPSLQQEYLTGGTDEILAQYTSADIDPSRLVQTVSHPIQDVNRRVFMTLKSSTGQATAISERAYYSAFGERTVLEQQSQTGLYQNRWLPRGFKDPLYPNLPAATPPNAFSEPKSGAGQTFGFQGHRHEEMPGVMNFRNRLYDARFGRFLEKDPHQGGPNPYSFGSNNPIKHLDPMGLDQISITADGRVFWDRMDGDRLVGSYKIGQMDRSGVGYSRTGIEDPNDDYVQLKNGGRATMHYLRQLASSKYSEDPSGINLWLTNAGETFEYHDSTSGTNLGIFLDGTQNDPSSETNVWKMFKQYKGARFYYSGCGSLGIWGAKDSSGGIPAHGTQRGDAAYAEYFNSIVLRALKDVQNQVAKGKSEIDIFGFSRGSAQAVELTREIWHWNLCVKIRFLGLFEPVYSVGHSGQYSDYVSGAYNALGNESESRYNGNYVVVNIPPNVKHAAVIYATYECRTWFPATKFTVMKDVDNTTTSLVTTKMLGAHGDIGGDRTCNREIGKITADWMVRAAEPYVNGAFAKDGSESLFVDPGEIARLFNNETNFSSGGISAELPNEETAWEMMDVDEIVENFYLNDLLAPGAPGEEVLRRMIIAASKVPYITRNLNDIPWIKGMTPYLKRTLGHAVLYKYSVSWISWP